MKILRTPLDVNQVDDPQLRALIERRIREIGQSAPWDSESMGYFIVVEDADSVEALEAQSGCAILSNRFDDARYPATEFAPSFEWLEKHDGYFEAVWILSDSGFGIDLFIPNRSGIEPGLLAMCETYAVPAPTPDTGFDAPPE